MKLPNADPTTGSLRSFTPPRETRCTAEDAQYREMRIFGGLPEDEHDSSDLRGPMLDVVLSLFDGIDYEDEIY